MFLFIQKNASMLPQIHKGDAILIGRNRRSQTFGNMLAIAINDNISIRKVEMKSVTIVFRALNMDCMDIGSDAEAVEENHCRRWECAVVV